MNDSEKTAAVIKWLQECYDWMEAGEEEKISPNLAYKSTRGVLTDDYVDRIIAKIEFEFEFELDKYPGYHFQNADGANAPPEFTRLSPSARRALVEGLDRALGNEDVS